MKEEKHINVIYIAHPYEGRHANVARVRRVMQGLRETFGEKYVFISALTSLVRPYQTGEEYIAGLMPCIELMSRCDGVLLSGDWEESIGCRAEIIAAGLLDIPVYMSPDDIREPEKVCKCKRTKKARIYKRLEDIVKTGTSQRDNYLKAERNRRRHKGETHERNTMQPLQKGKQ